MSTKILLHSCCGPCTIYPLAVLRNDNYDVTGFFYNPNIHPYKEFKRRLTTFSTFAEEQGLKTIIDSKYGLKEFLRSTVYKEDERCPICYEKRLCQLITTALEQGFDAFSTTLLYSRYQNHQLLKTLCEKLAADYSLDFIYHDFREGWQEGIEAAKEAQMYRQPYCGCIYSEQERYDRTIRK